MTRTELINKIGKENVLKLESEDAEATSRVIYPIFDAEHAGMMEYRASLELDNGTAYAYYYQPIMLLESEDETSDCVCLDWNVANYEFEEKLITMLQVNTVLQTNNGTPQYATPGAAGCDLKAELTHINDKFLFNAVKDNENKHLVIKPNGRALIPTGLHISLPEGYEAQVRPRSGLALKYGITVLNTPGTIDVDYIGDIGVILINHGTEDFIVNQGDRIAQLVITKYEQVEFNIVDTLEETERGEGGFGHTGK